MSPTSCDFSYVNGIWTYPGTVLTPNYQYWGNIPNGSYTFQLELRCSGISHNVATLTVGSNLDGTSQNYPVSDVVFQDPYFIFHFNTLQGQPSTWEGGPCYIRVR